jgi:predicted membrane-bound spermidine synthase
MSHIVANRTRDNHGKHGEDEYYENTWEELGVEHKWKNAHVRAHLMTNRGTYVEMVERPNWGTACYMDNAIQSCEVDEKFYHEALVHPVMQSVQMKNKKVMIIGGGEGATAREVLKWPDVEQVDMYEWDKDVVELFKRFYPQWAKGAWNDKRLTIYHDDIFEVIIKPVKKYDIIIIDLFDPSVETTVQWYILLKSISNWITPEGSIVMYSGMRNILVKQQPYHILYDIITGHSEDINGSLVNTLLKDRELIPYRVFIPSFSGESTFLLIKNKVDLEWDLKEKGIDSHITSRIWESYGTFNY